MRRCRPSTLPPSAAAAILILSLAAAAGRNGAGDPPPQPPPTTTMEDHASRQFCSADARDCDAGAADKHRSSSHVRGANDAAAGSDDEGARAAAAAAAAALTQRRRWAEFGDAVEKANNSLSPCKSDEKCGACFREQIEKDLAPFATISRSSLSAARAADPGAVTYQLLAGKLFRSPDCLFPSRCSGVEHFLHKVISGAAGRKLPATEIVLNLHDWPHIHKSRYASAPPPLFSFSKTSAYHDIFYPAWTFWEGGPSLALCPSGLGRWDLMRAKLRKAAKQWPWESKSNQAFFRGSRTSSERDNLILLSRAAPGLLDAAFTKNQAWRSNEDTLNAEPAEEVDLVDHCRYKYLFNFRGVAASFRFKHLFLCGSLVLHVGEAWQEFFYPALRPWFHYVPLEAQASKQQVSDVLHWLHSVGGESAAQTIADNGRRFVEKHLRLADVTCYWKRLLKKYAKLLDFQPTRNQAYIEVPAKL